MSLLSMTTDVFNAAKSSLSNIFSGDNSYNPKPVSNVSTQPVQVGTSYSKTVSTYEPLTFSPLALSVTKDPASTYKPNPLILGEKPTLYNPITGGIVDTYTAPTPSTKTTGNIWDIFSKVAVSAIDLGTNVLLNKINAQTSSQIQKANDPGAQVIVVQEKAASPEIQYVPVQQNPNSFTPSAVTQSQPNFPTSPLIMSLSPAPQAAIDTGMSSGIIQTASQPPMWIWIVLGVIVILFLIKRR